MSENQKRWRIKILTGGGFDQPISIYAESMSDLSSAARKWLRENPPMDFSNSVNNVSQSVAYAYSDGTRQPALPIQDHHFNNKPLEEGWWYITGEYGYPDRLENYDAVIEHFVQHGIIPEKGPDYLDMPLVEGQIPLHKIRSVTREEDIRKVNDMLQRGWYILMLEFHDSWDRFGKEIVVSRTTQFVLGHPEENPLL